MNFRDDARSLLRNARGAEIHFIPNNQGSSMISFGPDRLFGAVDDRVCQRLSENVRS